MSSTEEYAARDMCTKRCFIHNSKFFFCVVVIYLRNKRRAMYPPSWHCAQFHRLQASACSLIVCETMDLGDMIRDVSILHGESGMVAKGICHC